MHRQQQEPASCMNTLTRQHLCASDTFLLQDLLHLHTIVALNHDYC